MTSARVERPLTGPFWAAVEREELVRPVCPDCGTNFFSPQVVCPHCQSGAWSYRPSVGTGHVYSHTTIHRAPTPEFEPPYVVADIEMDEGWRLFSWVVNCRPADVHFDMAVQVCFVRGPDGNLLPAFEPTGHST